MANVDMELPISDVTRTIIMISLFLTRFSNLNLTH